MGAHLDNLQFAAENIDPWDYATSPLEAHKRAVLLRACGPRHFGRGLELACRSETAEARYSSVRARLAGERHDDAALREKSLRLAGIVEPA